MRTRIRRLGRGLIPALLLVAGAPAQAVECVHVDRLVVRPTAPGPDHAEVVYQAFLLNTCPERRVVYATLVLRDRGGSILEQWGPREYPVRAFGHSRVGERARLRAESVDAAASYELRLDDPL